MIAPYNMDNSVVHGASDDDLNGSTNGGDYLCVADDTGTVHVMAVPDHLRGQTNDDLVGNLVQVQSVTVTPSGNGKSVTVNDCHSKSL